MGILRETVAALVPVAANPVHVCVHVIAGGGHQRQSRGGEVGVKLGEVTDFSGTRVLGTEVGRSIAHALVIVSAASRARCAAAVSVLAIQDSASQCVPIVVFSCSWSGAQR